MKSRKEGSTRKAKTYDLHNHVIPATVIEAIRRNPDRYGTRIVGPKDKDASVGRRLWADTLGPPGTYADSYLGAMTVNTTTIVEALSRGRRTCRPEP